MLAGDIFQARPTNQLVKAIILVIIVASLVDVGRKLHRERRRVNFRAAASNLAIDR